MRYLTETTDPLVIMFELEAINAVLSTRKLTTDDCCYLDSEQFEFDCYHEKLRNDQATLDAYWKNVEADRKRKAFYDACDSDYSGEVSDF